MLKEIGKQILNELLKKSIKELPKEFSKNGEGIPKLIIKGIFMGTSATINK